MVGYPGVASLDILDNVVPYIGGEEEKMEWETSKILGDVDTSSESGFHMPKIPVYALTWNATNYRYPSTATVSPSSMDISSPSPSHFKNNLPPLPKKSLQPSHPTYLKSKIFRVLQLRNERLWY